MSAAPARMACDIDAHEGGRDNPEVGESRVAPAYIGHIEKGVPKALARGERLERGVGVGDGDKAITRIIALAASTFARK